MSSRKLKISLVRSRIGLLPRHSAAAFLPKRGTLLLCNSDGDLVEYDLKTLAPLRTLPFKRTSMSQILVDEDSKRLYVLPDNRFPKLFQYELP